MSGVNFDKAAKNLPTYCFGALKRISSETQQQFAFQLRALTDAAGMDPDAKSVSLGLALMSLTGTRILKKAVQLLGNRIR
jgi:hypothetical protein